jgi:hypothetical protein
MSTINGPGPVNNTGSGNVTENITENINGGAVGMPGNGMPTGYVPVSYQPVMQGCTYAPQGAYGPPGSAGQLVQEGANIYRQGVHDGANMALNTEAQGRQQGLIGGLFGGVGSLLSGGGGGGGC